MAAYIPCGPPYGSDLYMIPCQRHLFDLPDDVAYLNCAYLSPLMKAVMRAGQQGAKLEASPWEITPRDFFTTTEIARELFAQVVNASANDIAIVPAASYGIATAARNVPLERGQTIVLLEDQFPSNVYTWRERAKETGAHIATVRRPSNGDWTEATASQITEQTAVVALPNCHWTDGGLLDLSAISNVCRRMGAAIVLDITQSAGAMPFDVQQVQPDFLVAAGYKWLLGPYSLGFLYVAPKWQQGEPLEQNCLAREGSEDFAGLVNYRDEFQPGARRFDMGERANFQLLPMAVAALRQILDWRIEEIALTLAHMTATIAERAHALGLTSVPTPLRAGHFLGLRFPAGPPAGLLEKLTAEKIFVSIRGDSLRVTPHLYNTDADVDRLFNVLQAVV